MNTFFKKEYKTKNPDNELKSQEREMIIFLINQKFASVVIVFSENLLEVRADLKTTLLEKLSLIGLQK